MGEVPVTGLLVEGHDEATIGRIRSPIGDPALVGKEPATIAVSVAADLLRVFAAERAERMTAVLYRARAYDTPLDPFGDGAGAPASATTTTSGWRSPTTA